MGCVSSCTGTQRNEILTNCVTTLRMDMKTIGIPPGEPPGVRGGNLKKRFSDKNPSFPFSSQSRKFRFIEERGLFSHFCSLLSFSLCFLSTCLSRTHEMKQVFFIPIVA